MKNEVMKFLRDEEGATAIEYGLIAGLIAVAIVAILLAMRGPLQDIFGEARDGLNDAAAAPAE